MKPITRSAWIALVYVVTASTWILLSGELARKLASSSDELMLLERYKGIAFVLVTGVAVFLAVWRGYSMMLRETEAHSAAREALLAADRRELPGLFMSSLAHDANNVAAVVLASLSELSDPENALTQYGHEALDAAQTSMRQLTGLFADLKKMGAPSGKGAEPIDTDLRALVERDVALLHGHSAMKHCRVKVDATAPIVAHVRPSMVDQLLLNLLLNAAQATNGRGAIEVKLRQEEKAVSIEVHDDGPGVPEAVVPRLFTAFTTTKSEGTGLGLISVKECALAHRGQVTYSRSPLGGACFRVTLDHA